MVTFRFTKKLFARLKLTPSAELQPATTRLGDWYANLVPFGRKPLVLFVAERSLLPVVIELAPGATLLERFHRELPFVFGALAVARGNAVYEWDRMKDWQLGATVNRRVLGSMNDFAFMLPSYLDRDDGLLGASLHLAEARCSPIGMGAPEDVTRELLRR